jgi:hypothetical protein
MRMTGRARPRWRNIAPVAVVAVAFLTPGLLSEAAWAAPANPCPAAFPVSALTVGQPLSGLTVERGNTADPFTATVVGVINDGIGPDLDMIIVETDSRAIERAGGIWAGMSGSPVFTADERLVGAVAYGLSASPSNIAGLTPAADMYEILSNGATPAPAAAQKPLPASIRQRLVASGAATAAEAASGMRQLPIPLGVSGIAAGHLDEAATRLQKLAPRTRIYAAGAVSGTAISQVSDIFPGSNFAAALSYGDVSTVGIGTTTAVCSGDTALAFGHPALFTGPSSLSVHTADALYVQRDNTFGSFKVANPGGVVGTVDQDRLAGIRGKLGAGPPTTLVDSDLTANTVTRRQGQTRITLPRAVPDIAPLHLLSNLDRVADRIGGGVTNINWVIRVTRASGTSVPVSVRNRYADPVDASFASIFDVADQLAALETNRFENIKITEVDFTGNISSTFANYTLESLLVRLPSGQLVPAPTNQPLQVVAGSRINLRAVLRPYRSATVKNVDLAVVVPADSAGGIGLVQVVGGPGDAAGEPPPEPTSFDALLAQLRGLVPNDALTAQLSVEQETPTGIIQRRTSTRKIQDQVVVGGKSFPIEVIAPRRARPGVVDGNVWKLRSTLSPGAPTTTFGWGVSTDRQLMGDWDGNGSLTPGVFRNGTWYIRNGLTSGPSTTFLFGQANDVPVVGDWNGDGRDSIGVYRGGRWLLRNALSAGPADYDFTYGTGSQRPVVGDRNGDGLDTVGLFQNGTWSVRQVNSAGPATTTFVFGVAGDVPVTGEWDADGRDEPGVYRGGRWLLRDYLNTGPSSRSFTYGGATSRPLVWG